MKGNTINNRIQPAFYRISLGKNFVNFKQKQKIVQMYFGFDAGMPKKIQLTKTYFTFLDAGIYDIISSKYLFLTRIQHIKWLKRFENSL